jgi:WASH complex subunit 7
MSTLYLFEKQISIKEEV